MSVRGLNLLELIYVSNQVIAGFTVPGYTPLMLSETLALYNQNFLGCANRHLECFVCIPNNVSAPLPGEPTQLSDSPVPSPTREDTDTAIVAYVFLSIIALVILIVILCNRLNRREKQS